MKVVFQLPVVATVPIFDPNAESNNEKHSLGSNTKHNLGGAWRRGESNCTRRIGDAGADPLFSTSRRHGAGPLPMPVPVPGPVPVRGQPWSVMETSAPTTRTRENSAE